MTDEQPDVLGDLTPAEEDPGVPDAQENGTPDPEVEETDDKPRSREQKYRLQLRETEAELALVRAKLDDAHTREVEQYASALGDPKDLFTLTGSTADDYLDDDGLVDESKVRQAVNEILSKRPGLARRDVAVDPNQGRWSDSSATPSWAELLRD